MNEFSEQNLKSCRGFGIVSKVKNKNSGKLYAVKKIALNKNDSDIALTELKLMKKSKSRYVVEYIDS